MANPMSKIIIEPLHGSLLTPSFENATAGAQSDSDEPYVWGIVSALDLMRTCLDAGTGSTAGSLAGQPGKLSTLDVAHILVWGEA